MSEIIDQFYTPLLIGHGFIRDPNNQQYGALGDCWKLSPEVGEGTYWTYGQKDLYDIKIHNFSFHEDFMLECSMPECLSITRYDSISGEELSPYRRLSAGCIKTFIGGYAPYKALIHKNIPIRSVGIEIAPAYYEDYLKNCTRRHRSILWMHFGRSTKHPTFQKCHGYSQKSKTIAGKGLQQNFL